MQKNTFDTKYSDKSNECLGVNILHQITGNRLSELPDFKKISRGGGGGCMPPYPPRVQGAFGPFSQLRRVLTKGRQLLQILLKALLPLLQPPFVGHIHQANTNVFVSLAS